MRVFTKLNLLRVLLFLLLLLLGRSNSVSTQIVFYQDIFHGGATGDGFNPWFSGITGEFNLHIENNSIIKHAFLIYNVYGNPVDNSILFNGNEILLENDNTYQNNWETSNGSVSNYNTCLVDIKQYIDPFQDTYSITPPLAQISPFTTGGYAEFYLYVCYENPLMPLINSLVIFNQAAANQNIQITIDNINSVDLDYPAGLSINSSHFCDTIDDGSFVKLNSYNLGLIGGQELNNNISSCSGVVGSFYYLNNNLHGLLNDTPDNFMNGSDGTANISPYLTNNTQFDFSLTYQSGNSSSSKTNPLYELILAYTTTCLEFPVTVSNDTTICRNAPLQLSASGGTKYLWQPDTYLSCSTCPNPIFIGDSSRFYTVRIWNNDSCSVVRPVKVNVTQLPNFSSITTSASSCEGATGKILASSSLTGETYAINGGTAQATGNFFNLAPGFYTVTLQALNGCSKDSIVEVGSVISTNANFIANPAQGNAPLMVNFNNQSTNANNYEWFLNGISQGNNYTSELFDSIGIYTIQLIAWQNDPTCADTAFQTISVTSAGFYILGSSLVSASSNAQNTFSVLTNGSPIVKVTLYDAQGRLLKTKTNLQLIAGSNTIWSASELSDIASEMVLYRIEWQNAAESGELKGKVLFLK